MENLNTIPTAEEFLKQVSPNDEFGLRIDLGNSKKHIYEIMCRFAKLHVIEALKEASENADTIYRGDSFGDYIVDKDSILNSYLLTNIK